MKRSKFYLYRIDDMHVQVVLDWREVVAEEHQKDHNDEGLQGHESQLCFACARTRQSSTLAQLHS